MPGFFVKDNQIVGDSIVIQGQDAKHIGSALRMKIGDSVSISSDSGKRYSCEITDISREEVKAKILFSDDGCEPLTPVTILQGIPKGEKMELIIQKNVELGITRIIPVIMDRCVVKIQSPQDAEKKAVRWNRIAEEAAKQCGRSKIPEVSLPQKLSDVLENLPEDALKITAYENENNTSLKDILREESQNENRREIYFLIGPEGGISESEENCLKKSGFVSVSLGPRILRTETAGFMLLSAVRYEYGD